MRWIALVLCLLGSAANAQIVGDGMGGLFGVAKVSAGGGYTGPGDVVGTAKPWWGLRGYSGTVAGTGTQKEVTLRRASDAVECDILVATNGDSGLTSATCNSSTQGGITPAAFAGTDATASCTIAGTAMACTGASATIHVSDPVSGVGIDPRCIVTVTNGSTTATVVLAGTASTTCGTVGVAETVTFQVALFVKVWFDQSGTLACSGSTACDATQTTTARQPQFLPLGSSSGTKPAMLFSGGQLLATASLPGGAQPWSLTAVAIRTAVFTGESTVFAPLTANEIFEWFSSANTLQLFAGTSFKPTASDSAWHAIQLLYSGTSSNTVVDNGAAQTGNAGTTAMPGGAGNIGSRTGGAGSLLLSGLIEEIGLWPISQTPTQQTNICHNETYWAAFGC